MDKFRPNQWVRVKNTGETGEVQLRRDAMLERCDDTPLAYEQAKLVDRGPPFVRDQMGRYAVNMNRVGRGWVFYHEHEIEATEPKKMNSF